MSKKDKQETELRGVTATEQVEFKLNSFLTRNRAVLIIIGCVIVLALIIMLVANSIHSRQLTRRFDELDQAQTRYSELVAMDESSDEYKTGMDALKQTLQGLDKGKDYPALKARYLLAGISFEEKDYDDAESKYLSIYEQAKDTYLAPLALINAAVAAEEKGDDDAALGYYSQVWDEYGEDAPESPKALFNQARLQGKKGENDLAKATFQQLIDQFPTSEYGRLAQTAILSY